MHLTEQHIIRPSNENFKQLKQITHLSKNLFNATLYQIRQEFITNKKYLSYNTLAKQFSTTNNPDYRALPAKVAQQTMKLVDQCFKSFFALLKKPDLKSKAKITKYLEKTGYYVTTYTNQAISYKKKGYINLSGTDIFIKTNKTDIQQVRIVPQGNHFTIEIVYKAIIKPQKEMNDRFASIDLGLNNLAAVGSNCQKPYLINGKPLKAINQFYNKEVARLKSILEKENKSKISKKIKNLGLTRKNKIKDYFHKASRYIINQLVSSNINTLIIGENKEWKQEINIGAKNNQKFVMVPHQNFKAMLKYKAQLEGIQVVMQEESYTSKASFLSGDKIPLYGKENGKHEFSGYRQHRGLYRVKGTGKDINADINGALNILRKAVGDFYYDPIVVCSTPKLISVRK